MPNITIQKVTLSDIDQLQKISIRTFSETFAVVNTEANMKKYLDEGFSLEKLTAELNENNEECYFATLDNEVIGYLKLKFGLQIILIRFHHPSCAHIVENHWATHLYCCC